MDGQKYQGTCYKASGWTLLGQTQGYQRARPDFYQAHQRPKQLWVRELRPGARTILRGRNLPPALQALEQKHPPECPQEPEELRRMRRFFQGLTDWRHGSFDFAVSSPGGGNRLRPALPSLPRPTGFGGFLPPT